MLQYDNDFEEDEVFTLKFYSSNKNESLGPEGHDE